MPRTRLRATGCKPALTRATAIAGSSLNVGDVRVGATSPLAFSYWLPIGEPIRTEKAPYLAARCERLLCLIRMSQTAPIVRRTAANGAEMNGLSRTAIVGFPK